MRLQDLRQRAQSRISTETDEEREVRLQDLRQRAQSRISTETDEEREVRLQDLRQRAQSRISTETDEEREVRLQDLRQCSRQGDSLEILIGKESQVDVSDKEFDASAIPNAKYGETISLDQLPDLEQFQRVSVTIKALRVDDPQQIPTGKINKTSS